MRAEPEPEPDPRAELDAMVIEVLTPEELAELYEVPSDLTRLSPEGLLDLAKRVAKGYLRARTLVADFMRLGASRSELLGALRVELKLRVWGRSIAAEMKRRRRLH